MSATVKAAVAGANGYAGMTLVNLLARHPNVELRLLGSDKWAGETAARRAGLAGAAGKLKYVSQEQIVHLARECAAVLLATPADGSLKLVPILHAFGVKVIDLSGAFRLRNAGLYPKHYGFEHTQADLLSKAFYGLPELSRTPAGTALVANPGCYPTSVILGLRPLVDSGWINRPRGIVCDCKSGASGAGKEPKRELHFVEVDENIRAYGLFSHRHTPEVTDHLGLSDEDIVFTTHLLPLARGILSTLYVWLAEPHAAAEVESLYRKFYAGRPMMRIWPAGKLPELQHVAHTNFCDIGFALDPSGRRLAVVSCLDNLGKGAAGQAVQNLNHILGIEEQTSLQ